MISVRHNQVLVYLSIFTFKIATMALNGWVVFSRPKERCQLTLLSAVNFLRVSLLLETSIACARKSTQRGILWCLCRHQTQEMPKKHWQRKQAQQQIHQRLTWSANKQ